MCVALINKPAIVDGEYSYYDDKSSKDWDVFNRLLILLKSKRKDNKFVCPLCHSLIVITYYYDSRVNILI